MNEQREKLIEIIGNAPASVDCIVAEADYLLKNGVAVLPCKLGDTVYANFSIAGSRLRRKNRPHKCKIVFIGISEKPFIHIEFETGNVFPVDFEQIGKTVFLSREKAKAALEGRYCD